MRAFALACALLVCVPAVASPRTVFTITRFDANHVRAVCNVYTSALNPPSWEMYPPSGPFMDADDGVTVFLRVFRDQPMLLIMRAHANGHFYIVRQRFTYHTAEMRVELLPESESEP